MNTLNRKIRILLVDSPDTNIIKGSCPPGEPIASKADHPLGLLYIGTNVQRTLGKSEVEIKTLGFRPVEKRYLEITKETMREFKPDIVGLTTYTFTIYDTYQIAKLVKSENPNAFVILGGINTSFYPEEMIKQPFIDAIAIGDGEETFLDFVKNFGTPEMYSIRGIWIKKNGDIMKNPMRQPISNLDVLPFPDRNLLIFQDIYQESYIFSGCKKTELLSSRGCPYSCEYCQSSGKKYRARTPKNVVDEIEYLLSEGYNLFQFWDETFNIQKERSKEIFREIIRRNLQKKVRYRVRIVGNLVDEEMMQLMKESGCQMIYLGIESASNEILRSVNRKIEVEKCIDTVYLAKKYGISVLGYFIIGFPGETEKDIQKTIKLILKLPLDFMETTILTPIPNTPIYSRAISEGKMDDWYRRYTLNPWKNAWYKYYETAVPGKRIYEIQKRIYFKFYFRPSYVLKMALRSPNKSSFMIRAKTGLRLLSWILSKDQSNEETNCENCDLPESSKSNLIPNSIINSLRNLAKKTRSYIKLSVEIPLKIYKLLF